MIVKIYIQLKVLKEIQKTEFSKKLEYAEKNILKLIYYKLNSFIE